jgi:hypothetical protein
MRERIYQLLDYLRQRSTRLTRARRLKYNLSHEVCCHFDQYLASFLAPRLRWYVEFMRDPDNGYGVPAGYPDPDKAWAEAESTDGGPKSNFDQWRTDVERACKAAEARAKGVTGDETDEEEDRVSEEWKWALQWLARWSGGVWV